MKDPEFLVDANKARMYINPTPGKELEEIVHGFAKLPSSFLARLKDILVPKKN